MYESDHFDDELARLAGALRSGDFVLGGVQLAKFALALEHCMRCEERTLATLHEHVGPAIASPLDKVRGEHASLRRLVGLIGRAIDRADARRAVEVVSKLRSVLLLHLTKEQRWYEHQAEARS